MKISVVKTQLTEETSFSDVNLFTGQNDRRTLVTQVDAINQNIMMILDTPIRSKWWRPRVGCMIPFFLFEPMDDLTASKIKQEMLTVLETNGETRVTILAAVVLPNYEQQYYFVELQYEVPWLNLNNVQFAFNLSKS